jgi:flagellar FliJ protein
MAKFIFKLEAVLRQRKHVEGEKQRALALVQAQMTQLQNELRLVNETVQSSTTDLRENRLVGKLDLHFLAAHRRFTLATQRKAMQLVQKMALVQRSVDVARLALAEAARDRKAIEKLREKHHQRWAEDIGRREAAQLDEISMQMSYENALRDQVHDAEAAAS